MAKDKAWEPAAPPVVEPVASPAVQEEISLPKKPEPGSYEAMLVEKWRDQKRVRCKQKGCYYPLNVYKPESRGHREKVIQVEDPETGLQVPAVEAECSWDPKHLQGQQFIILPRKENSGT